MFSKFLIVSTLVSFTTAKNLSFKNIAMLEKINSFRNFIQSRIYPNHSVVHRLIQDDFYVRQWLAENNFVVNRTVLNFMEHLAWRHAQNIDKMHLETWEDFSTVYPFFINQLNGSCNIVSELWITDWNIHRAVLVGKSSRLLRWSIYRYEMAQRLISEKRMNPDFLGKNCTSFDIVDMGKYSTWEHGCIQCLNLIAGSSELAEKHYPNIWTKVYMVNSSPLFRQVLVTLGKNSKTLSKGIMKTFGREHEWLPTLENNISKDQRSKRFRGNLIRDIDEN